MLRYVALFLVLAGCHAPRTLYLRNVSGAPMVLHLPSGDTSAFFEGQPTVIPLEASGEKRTWLITYATEARWTDADREALAQILEASELVVDAQRVPLKGRFTISSYGGPVNELFVRISRTD